MSLLFDPDIVAAEERMQELGRILFRAEDEGRDDDAEALKSFYATLMGNYAALVHEKESAHETDD